jgi:hypothetical protein
VLALGPSAHPKNARDLTPGTPNKEPMPKYHGGGEAFLIIKVSVKTL